MPLQVGHRDVGSTAKYYIEFSIHGRVFSNYDVGNPHEALRIVRELQTKGYKPRIHRLIVYDFVNGLLVKAPERQSISIKRLEEIVRTDEPLPTHIVQIIDTVPMGVEEGD